MVVGGQTSNESTINASVPQGSILGPTLFLVFIDDMCDQLTNPSRLYADDSTLYCCVDAEYPEQCVVTLNSDLSHIHNWGLKWKVNFAPEKCKVMSITKKATEPQGDLFLGGTKLQECEELDILGVNFQKNLSFSSHLDTIAEKAGTRMNMFRKAALYLDANGRSSVYKALPRRTMEYAPLAWMSASETHLRRLDHIQHRAENIIGPQRPGCELDSLAHRRLISGLGLLHRMQKEGEPELIRSQLPQYNKLHRSTRANAVAHSLKTPAGRTESGHWSLHQYDRSFLPATVPVWNSLPPQIVGNPSIDSTKTFCKCANRHLKGICEPM